ncbi:hypothetical protein ACROYT_G038949 [Oculina patagonica]
MNYLILNLAVADIMVALFIVPRFIFVHLFKHPDGMKGTVLCKLLTGGNLIWIGSVATAFTLVVVAIERYHAVVNSHSNQGQLTAAKVEAMLKVRRRVTKMVVTVSAVFALCRIPALTMYVVSYFSPSQDYSDVLHINIRRHGCPQLIR